SSAATWAAAGGGGLTGAVYLQGGSSTLSGTSIVMTNMFSDGSIPAGAFTAGSVLYMRAMVKATNNDSSIARNANFQFVVNGNIVGGLKTHSVAALGGNTVSWLIECMVSIPTTGASVTVHTYGTETFNTTRTEAADTTFSYDTTSSGTCNLQACWNTAPDT